MKTRQEILENCIKKKKGELAALTARQLPMIDDLTEKMFKKCLTEVDLPEGFGKPTDDTIEYINKTLGLAVYLNEDPPVISLLITDIEALDKIN